MTRPGPHPHAFEKLPAGGSYSSNVLHDNHLMTPNGERGTGGNHLDKLSPQSHQLRCCLSQPQSAVPRHEGTSSCAANIHVNINPENIIEKNSVDGVVSPFPLVELASQLVSNIY
jgi:hypothetical protein